MTDWKFDIEVGAAAAELGVLSPQALVGLGPDEQIEPELALQADTARRAALELFQLVSQPHGAFHADDSPTLHLAGSATEVSVSLSIDKDAQQAHERAEERATVDAEQQLAARNA